MGRFSSPFAVMALALLLVALSFTVSLASEASSSPKCEATLTKVADIPTEGNSGFESWYEDSGDLRLIAASLWDMVSPDMSSGSWIYNVTSAPKGGLNVVPLQRLASKGATQAHMIAPPMGMSGRSMLLINNHMQCGGREEAKKSMTPCGPTSIYVQNGPLWEEYKSIKTLGPLKAEHMVIGKGVLWMVVTENFSDEVSIWNFNSEKYEWTKQGSLAVSGVSDAVLSIVDQSLFVTTCSKQHPNGGRSSSCPVFALLESAFHQIQNLPSTGAVDLDAFEFEGEHFLFVANERSDKDHRVDSHIHKFLKGATMWTLNQTIPTEGARAGHFFVKGGDLWLGIANFGDMLKGKVESESNLWKYNKGTKQFDKMVEVDSFGATGWHGFELGGHYYVALANQGHLTAKKYQTSYVYRLDEKCEGGAGKGEL